MIVWGKTIECIIDADVNYLNGELFNSQFRVKGKFLVFGNLYTLEKTTPGGETIQICSPVDATFMAYYQGMVAVISFYIKEKDIYANVSLTDPDTIKDFITMSTYYRKYGVSIPNVLDKIMYRKVPT
jgi:hypothetical protein